MAYNTRNKLVHEYPLVQAEILFKASINELPKLQEQMKIILDSEILEEPNF